MIILKIALTEEMLRENEEIQLYNGRSETRLLRYCEPKPGLFIAESPNVIRRALADGYCPISFLAETAQMETFSDLWDMQAETSFLREMQTETSALREMQAETSEQSADPAEEPHVFPEHTESEGSGSLLSREVIPVYHGERHFLESIAGFALTKGVMCLMRRRELPSPETILVGKRRIAVLEDVVNPTNIGAIFRSAAALGVEAVLLTGGCSDPLYRRAARVGMGTMFQVPWTYLPEDWIGLLKQHGFRMAAMALTDESIRPDAPGLASADKLAVILGTEGDGLRKETIAACDDTVCIPMKNDVDSLNVAAASAVIFWELCGRNIE